MTVAMEKWDGTARRVNRVCVDCGAGHTLLRADDTCINSTSCARRQRSRHVTYRRSLETMVARLSAAGYEDAAERVREAVRLMSASVHSPPAGWYERKDG